MIKAPKHDCSRAHWLSLRLDIRAAMVMRRWLREEMAGLHPALSIRLLARFNRNTRVAKTCLRQLRAFEALEASLEANHV